MYHYGRNAFQNGEARNSPYPDAETRLKELRADVFRYQKSSDNLPESLQDGPDLHSEWLRGWDDAKAEALQIARVQGLIAKANQDGPIGDRLPVTLFHIGIAEQCRSEWMAEFQTSLKGD